MKQQTLNFNGPIKTFINNYNAAPLNESKTATNTVAVTPTQKEAIKSIASEMNIGASTLVGEALDHYLDILPNLEKFNRHKELIFTMLNSLP